MRKFYGEIGFVRTVEEPEGVFIQKPEERCYKGNILKDSYRYEHGASVNDDVRLSNRISILADIYSEQNAYAIKYVKYLGTAWKVDSVSVEPPRIILTLGGPYNGYVA